MHAEHRTSASQSCPRRDRGRPAFGRNAGNDSELRASWRVLRLTIRRSVGLALVGLAAATATARAATPPRSNLQSVGEVAAAERRSPAIGLVTSRAPDVLRDQLGLDRGAGLVVEAVAVGSHAEKAGLKRHDVLVSLDDQLLVLPEQLATLVAASRPDATLVIDVRRGGKSLEIVLGLSPAPTLPQSIPAGPEPPAPQTPDRVPATVASAPAAPASNVPPPASLPASEEALPMTAAGSGATPGPPPVATAPPIDFVPPPGSRRLGPNAVVIDNRDFWIKVYRDTETCLMVRDARGWLLFNGPIATPQQRSLIPRRVRDRVIQLETMLDVVAARTDAPPAGAPRSLEPVTAAAPVAAAPGTPAQEPPGPGRIPAKEAEPFVEIGSLDVAPIEIR